MTRIAIMQPYFLPYAGYFRLMVNVDAFVIADVQQFSRGSWVNRNRLRDDRGRLGWLTLPLRHQPLTTPIRELAFADEADLLLGREMQRYPACRQPPARTQPLVDRMRHCAGTTPLAMITELLQRTAGLLGLNVPMLRQSSLGLPEGLRGGEHVHAVCTALGAREYLNAPGGRALHDPVDLRRRGLRLLFLQPYPGDPSSVLQRLHDDDEHALRREILGCAEPEDA